MYQTAIPNMSPTISAHAFITRNQRIGKRGATPNPDLPYEPVSGGLHF